MRLFVTRPSPFARKAWAAVLELDLAEQVAIEELPARMPSVPKPDLEAVNPLSKVPALIAENGALIVDSAVIVAYLDSRAGGGRLIPAGEERWRALSLEALANGCMEAGIVIRVEQLKDEQHRLASEIETYSGKIARTLDHVEREPHWLGDAFNVGQLALACVLDWLVFRNLFAEPLAGRPRLAAWLEQVSRRPALVATRPSA